MKDFISTNVPEDYREHALYIYSTLPEVPQLPEMAPEKAQADNEEGGVPGQQLSFTDPSKKQNLAKFINYTVVLLSVLAQFQDAYDYIAFSGNAIIGNTTTTAATTDDPEQSEDAMPRFWTMLTCVFFESNWFFLAVHLLILNYLVNQLEHVWSRRSFAALAIFSAFWTSLLRLTFRASYASAIEAADAGDKSIMAESYCSINHLIVLVLMGCRQGYPERQLDTFIPFITDNVIVPFKHLPVMYVFLCWLFAFIFEMSIDFSLMGSLYFAWLYMRLFMTTKQSAPNQIGDPSTGFALTTFFPERAQPTVEWMTKVAYKAANICKLVDGVQACLKARNVAHAKTKAENRKRALEMLQDEIDKKETDEKKEQDDADDLENNTQSASETGEPAKNLDRDVVVKKSADVAQRSALNKNSAAESAMTERERAELENFKKQAASVDLTGGRNLLPSSFGGKSAATETKKEESKMELKDEPSDEEDELEIQFESDRPAND